MDGFQERYDDAMFDFSCADYDRAIERLEEVIQEKPDYFDALLSLGMAYCRRGEFAKAIELGHRAERLRPDEQLVHTNLSLFYMKNGQKDLAESHGLKARIASWKGNMEPGGAVPKGDPELEIGGGAETGYRTPEKFPEMPWKKNKKL